MQAHFARLHAIFAASSALLYTRRMLLARLSPPVMSLIFASRKGVVCLPWMPRRLASYTASSMALLITSGSMEYCSGMGLVTSMPPFISS